MFSMQEVRNMKRHNRNPEHCWQVRYRPHTVQPTMIAPILPGETLKHALMQTRTVSHPIANPLIGWWNEHWLFFVPLQALSDKFRNMLVNPTEDMTSLDDATHVDYYHENTSSGTDINYAKRCTEVIVDNFFRAEGETSSTSGTTLTGSGGGTMPMAGYRQNWYTDSAIADADYVTAADENLTDAGSEQGTAVYISEIANAFERWQLERHNGLTQLTFEEACAAYWGGTASLAKPNSPELLRYSSEWTYPTNTIDTTNGTPRSAVSWAKQWSADKARLFKEPGFLVMVTTSRPKVYLKNLSSNAVMLMKDTKTWLPPSLMEDTHASMTKVASGDAPLTASNSAYWVDVNDILQYGDQFYNFATSATDANFVSSPVAANTDVGRRFPTSADLDALFTAASPANQIREDGICKLTIASRRHEDTSPNAVGNNISIP